MHRKNTRKLYSLCCFLKIKLLSRNFESETNNRVLVSEKCPQECTVKCSYFALNTLPINDTKPTLLIKAI